MAMRPRGPTGLSHMSPAVSAELPHAPPTTPTHSPGTPLGLLAPGAAGGTAVVAPSLLGRGSSVHAAGAVLAALLLSWSLATSCAGSGGGTS